MLKKIIDKLTFSLATANLKEDDSASGSTLLDDFIAQCQRMDAPHVLELGTLRSVADRSTKHDEWIPNAGEYLGTDIESGTDVDIVADVHRLSHFVGTERFDAIISCSTAEHFKYPHLAAHELMKTLRIGGLLFLQTHQSYPIHAYPYDYFRFSREALAGLFGTQMGFDVLATDYEFPANLYTPRERTLYLEPTFLNVRLFGKKRGPTPEDYIYEYDTALQP